MKRLISVAAILSISFICIQAQSRIVKDFKPVCDSLSVLIQEHTSVKGKLELQAVMKRGSTLDFYFNQSLSDYPWHKGDVQWFRENLKALFPEEYGKYRLGEIYSKRISHENLITSVPGNDGNPSDTRHRIKNPERQNIVTPYDGPAYEKGLEGRHIAIWHSHGYYYNHSTDRWQWQRPVLFQTVEDMFTQSFVLPYLAPMLENAGAYVLMPRERDIQRNEVIADNDVTDASYGNSQYKETGKWRDAGSGFAAVKATYSGEENPFTEGSARKAECIQNGKKNKSHVIWTPEIPERGSYAVHISYKSLPESTSSALYTVRHMGGESSYIVNQKMGGGTWIYLGTFEFDEGSSGHVSLTNETPEGYRFSSGKVITADAVRFGGGMGNIARGPEAAEGELAPEPAVSGMPRYAEGARYWLQWAGADKDIFSQNKGTDDYKDDFMSRGDWVEWISRGSGMNEGKKGPGIPIDLALGFHSDAGITPADSIVGTLSIYTLRSEGSQNLPSGESRMTSRNYADMVQTQIVNDLRESYDTLWSRRQIWDRGYRESRTPSSPSMLLELLSHQNFADMKYGLDPSFRFTVSRSVYKGMLKYLCSRYGVGYEVQPLPVESLGVKFSGNGRATLSWKARKDELEPTAEPEGFIIYTRIDEGGFDNGRIADNLKKRGDRFYADVDISEGHIYSFKVEAYNDGGKSFPSETVSIGIPKDCRQDRKVLIVNNFDRVSGPSFFDTPTYAGFNSSLDGGVPHICDISFIGNMYQFNRQAEYVSNDNPGFGACDSYHAGKPVAGNTFDFIITHGKAVMKAGYPFYSCSNESFCNDSTFRKSAWCIDLICGKQVTTSIGSGLQQKYEVFPAPMRNALKEFSKDGGSMLISGAYIATDAWDSIYPVKSEEESVAECRKFISEILGYRWGSARASRTGQIHFVSNRAIQGDRNDRMSICNEINSERYCVESPDGIVPVSADSATIMRYSDSGIPAGICHEGKGYRTVCLGFPIESLEDEKDIDNIIGLTLDYFTK